jgi:hypothetical protein
MTVMEIESVGCVRRARFSARPSVRWLFGGVLFGLLLLESLVVIKWFEHINPAGSGTDRILEWAPELVLLNVVFIALMVCAGLASLIRIMGSELRAARDKLERVSGRLDELVSHDRELVVEIKRIRSRLEKGSSMIRSRSDWKQGDPVTSDVCFVHRNGDPTPLDLGVADLGQGPGWPDQNGEPGNFTKAESPALATGPSRRPDWKVEVDRLFLHLCRDGQPGSVIWERLSESLSQIPGDSEVIQMFRNDRLGAALEFSSDPARMGVAQQYLAFGSERSGYWLLPKPQRADRNFADLTGFRISGPGPREIDRLRRVVSARLRPVGAGVFTISEEPGENGELEFA